MLTKSTTTTSTTSGSIVNGPTQVVKTPSTDSAPMGFPVVASAYDLEKEELPHLQYMSSATATATPLATVTTEKKNNTKMYLIIAAILGAFLIFKK